MWRREREFLKGRRVISERETETKRCSFWYRERERERDDFGK